MFKVEFGVGRSNLGGFDMLGGPELCPLEDVLLDLLVGVPCLDFSPAIFSFRGCGVSPG